MLVTSDVRGSGPRLQVVACELHGRTFATSIRTSFTSVGMECPRISSTDVDVLWLLAIFGEACLLTISGVY
jgi:hypothetical protein